MHIANLVGRKPQIKCPRCGGKLSRSQLRKTLINRCSKGCGVWIDQQQLDQLAGTKSKRYEVTNDLPPQSWNRTGAI